MAVIKAVSSKAGINTVLDYVMQEEKTEQKLLSGLNCVPDTVKDEMRVTKLLWDKDGGRTYKHFVQSFAPGEKIDPAQAHQIACQLAASRPEWQDFEVLIATHEDKEHIHTHFVVNSVSYVDGHILTKQTQKEIINIREDIEWNKQHEHIAKIERMLPKATEENKNVLLRLQTEMLKTYNIAKRLEPTTASAERTIECDGRKVPYFDYHKDKLIGDISFIRDKIESSLEAIRERAKTAEPQSGFVARRESIMRQEQPKQDAPKIDTAYAEEMARKLSALRSEFVKAMVQSAERTSYQPNPIYERQANEIESISKTISEQSRTIKSLQEERDKLGIFKGREKKELQNKIDNFERLRRSNLDKLGALGVSEPSKADEAVKEKRSVAAQEQNRAKAAMQNRGAKERAEEVKAAFLEAAKQIPADQRQEILDRMGQQKEIPTMGRLQYYQAEAEARRQLDTALKQEAQTRERNRTHDRDRGI